MFDRVLNTPLTFMNYRAEEIDHLNIFLTKSTLISIWKFADIFFFI